MHVGHGRGVPTHKVAAKVGRSIKGVDHIGDIAQVGRVGRIDLEIGRAVESTAPIFMGDIAPAFDRRQLLNVTCAIEIKACKVTDDRDGIRSGGTVRFAHVGVCIGGRRAIAPEDCEVAASAGYEQVELGTS